MHCGSPERAAELCSSELLIAEKGLRRNPKCYSAWHHRLWLLDLGHCDLNLELTMCAVMLDLDARNCRQHNTTQHSTVVRHLSAALESTLLSLTVALSRTVRSLWWHGCCMVQSFAGTIDALWLLVHMFDRRTSSHSQRQSPTHSRTVITHSVECVELIDAPTVLCGRVIFCPRICVRCVVRRSSKTSATTARGTTEQFSYQRMHKQHDAAYWKRIDDGQTMFTTHKLQPVLLWLHMLERLACCW